MKRGIITPTFEPHFKFVDKYLESAMDFLEDPNEVTFFFTVSEKEIDKLESLITKYKSKLNLKILSFENILKHFDVPYTNWELLNKYEKFSYQTLKKFYTMLFLEDYEQFLVIDSESMFVRPTSIKQLFDNYFNTPFITKSRKFYKKPENFNNQVIENYSLILDEDTSKQKTKYLWFLENFVWFYDRKIMIDMFENLGEPLSLVDKVYNYKYPGVGLFEICIYHGYIYQYNDVYNYGYNVFDADKIIKETFIDNDELYDNYIKQKNTMWSGMLGALELTMNFLNEKNYSKLAEAFKRYNFNIIRCESTDFSTYKYQKEFLDIAKPNILSASQNHTWGVNNQLKTRLWKLMVFNNKYARWIWFDMKGLLRPLSPLYRWLRLFYLISKHSLIWAKQVLDNLDILKK